MLAGDISEALTFDDVSLVPARSGVLPTEADTTTRFTRNIPLNIPISSAAMDTVTESHLAIAIAQQGGIGVVHKNLSIEHQRDEVDKVKRSESGMIVDPVTMTPDHPISDAVEVMERYRISGVPIVEENGHLVGILTNRDLRFETRLDLPIREAMTKDNLITVPVGTTLNEAKAILQRHRVEKLLVVDDNYRLKGLITVKDIQKAIRYPLAAKDDLGRLRVAAAVGATGDYMERAEELIRARVDAMVIDTAHGHTESVISAAKNIKRRFPEVDLVAGNIATAEATRDLISAGVDAVKAGIGPRLDLHNARGKRCRCAADYCDIGMLARGPRNRRAGDCGWRDQVLGRYQQGDCCGRRLGDDRIAVCRNRREPGRDNPVPRPLVQELSRDGFALGDERGQPRPLRPGERISDVQARARRDRRTSSAQGSTRVARPPTGRRTARWDGLLWLQHDCRASREGTLHTRHIGGLTREPRARRDHHKGSAELPD